MAETSQTERPWYFYLNTDGDNAVVRLLHTKVGTIESIKSHRVKIGDKSRRVRCLGDNCPLCSSGNKAEDRIYIHLWDYTDNKEKVWERTDKILPQLTTLENDWGNLSETVIRITRKGNEFPKYEINLQNPKQFAEVNKLLVDKSIAKLYLMNRNAEEISTFLKTGNFPEKKPYVSKEEYFKQKEAEKQKSTQPVSQDREVDVDVDMPGKFVPIPDNEDFDDPFMDSYITPPRKV